MAVDLDALATADLADLLAVVERWAGLVTHDDESADPFGDPTRRVAPTMPIDPPAPSGRSDHTEQFPRDTSPRTARHGADRGPDELPPSAAPSGDPSDRSPGPVARADAGAVRAHDIDGNAAGAPAFGPWPSGASPDSTHWSGRLPTMRTAPHDRVRLRPAHHRPAPPEPIAASRPTPAVDRAQPVTASPGAGATDATRAIDAGSSLAGRSPTGERPTSFVRPAPDATRFPIPVLIGHGAAPGAPVETAGVRAGNASPAPVGGAEPTPAPPGLSATRPVGIDPMVAELIARERLSEAVADVIEEALLDAGVDLS